jgi:hypothetical protein
VSKPEEKRRAIELRRQGLSYREIREQVRVAKATLSLWLRTVGLSQPQRRRLAEKKLAAGRRGVEKVRRQRLERVARTLDEAEAEARHWIDANDSRWMVGTALYWAEGSKPKPWSTKTQVAFSNMDPGMTLIVRAWLARYCGVADDDLVYLLQIHERADIPTAVVFWAARLGVPPVRIRITLKRHNPAPRRKNAGEGYYGTMQMRVRRSTCLSHRIAGWTRGLVKHCGVG